MSPSRRLPAPIADVLAEPAGPVTVIQLTRRGHQRCFTGSQSLLDALTFTRENISYVDDFAVILLADGRSILVSTTQVQTPWPGERPLLRFSPPELGVSDLPTD